MDRLNVEVAETNKLLKLLNAKRSLIGGEGIEHVSSSSSLSILGLKHSVKHEF